MRHAEEGTYPMMVSCMRRPPCALASPALVVPLAKPVSAPIWRARFKWVAYAAAARMTMSTLKPLVGEGHWKGMALTVQVQVGKLGCILVASGKAYMACRGVRHPASAAKKLIHRSARDDLAACS